MKRLVVALVVVVAAACSSSSHSSAPTPTPVTPTTVRADCTPRRAGYAGVHTFTFAGGERKYALALPRGFDGTHATPMVVLIHGHASSKEAIDIDTAMEKKGTKRGFIVVTPDGSGTPKTWNLFGDAKTSDYAFLDALVVDLEQKLCVDKARVFAAGHSAGSAFAGFLVCRKPYRFAGVAMVSATVPSTCPANVVPRVLGIHGTADPVVLYNGGLGAGQTTPIPPITQTIANLAKRAHCASLPMKDVPAAGVERLRYEQCKAQVALITIVGGNHPWPGGFQATHMANAVAGAHFDATNAILDFFAPRSQ